MKESGSSHWISNTDANNQSGFTALPGGERWLNNGTFIEKGTYGYWWSSTEEAGFGLFRRLDNNNGSVYRNGAGKVDGFSIRCLKDSGKK